MRLHITAVNRFFGQKPSPKPRCTPIGLRRQQKTSKYLTVLPVSITKGNRKPQKAPEGLRRLQCAEVRGPDFSQLCDKKDRERNIKGCLAGAPTFSLMSSAISSLERSTIWLERLSVVKRGNWSVRLIGWPSSKPPLTFGARLAGGADFEAADKVRSAAISYAACEDQATRFTPTSLFFGRQRPSRWPVPESELP